MDNLGRDYINPFSSIVPDNRRITRSITRALDAQVVGSILTQIDTGVERPIDFVPTDYLNRCADLIFGRTSEQLPIASVRITDDFCVNTYDNSINFSRKLENLSRLSEMSQEKGNNIEPGGSQDTREPVQMASNDQLSQLMSMILKQNQMMTNCMNEIRQFRGEVASLSNRVAEVECSTNACSIAAPGSSSTPDKHREHQINMDIPNISQSSRAQQSRIGIERLTQVSYEQRAQGGSNRRENNDVGETNCTDRSGSPSINYRQKEMDYRKPFNLDKWHIKFDGSGKEMMVESFIFRIEKMREQHNISYNQLFSDFHCLVSGTAAKWYWQVLEDNAEDVDFGYFELKKEILTHFKSADTDYEIIKEIMDYKQQPGQEFEDFYMEIHNLTFRLRKKIPEIELVQIIKSNLRSNIASLVFSATIETIAELKKECKRAEKLIKEIRHRPKLVNEIIKECNNEEDQLEAFGTVSGNVHMRNDQKNVSNYTNQSTTIKPRHIVNANNSTSMNHMHNLQTTNKHFCMSPFHLNLCFSCGMPVDFYRKNSDIIKSESICKSTFHDMKCFACGKDDSLCEYNPNSLNVKMAERTGNSCQKKENPETRK